MNKKVLAAGFASVLAIASMGIGVFAVDPTIEYDEIAGTSDVAYTTTEGYIISIPASFTLTGEKGEDKEATGDVSASEVLLTGEKILNVKVKAENGALTLEGGTQGISSIAYSIKIGEQESAAADKEVLDVFTINAGETDHEAVAIDLTATADAVKAANLAGEHKDKLTFSVSVEDAVKD